MFYFLVKKRHDLEKSYFGFVNISHSRYKLRRDVEQTPLKQISKHDNGFTINDGLTALIVYTRTLRP
jgi:hypothetical protein